MKQFLMIMAILVGTVMTAQHDEAYVTELTKDVKNQLIAKGITTFFSYKKYCSGEIQMFQIKGKMCISKGTYYEVFVIWNENGTDFIQKLDNCGLYDIEQMPDTSLTDFYIKEYSSLVDDVVKPYRSETYTGEPELRKDVQPCSHGMEFVKGSREVQKEFNLFAISNDSEGANKNYAFNQSLKLVKFYYLLDETLITKEFTRK